MRAIPKRMLPHSAIFNEYLGDGGRGINYGSDIELLNVKIEDKKTLSETSNGREIVGNAIMFYDLKNSSGLNNLPKNHSKIFFNEREYHIVDTEILYANDNNPHHYEMVLK